MTTRWQAAYEACRAVADARRRGDKNGMRTHVEEAWRAVAGQPATDPALASDVYQRMAGGFRDIGESDRALEAARKCVELERIAGRPALLRNHLMYLADLLAERGDFAGATKAAREGHALYQEALGVDHSETKRAKRFLDGYEETARASN